MPDQFWSLTIAEFHIKHGAFARAEDRQRGMVFELAGLIGMFNEKDRTKVTNNARALRRYPIKPWLQGD